MDPSPQPILSSSSRLLSAFQKIYHSSVKQPASIAPLETVKPVGSKSSSFTDRIKNKFQAKRKSQLSMTRSGSLSSMAKRWSSNKKESSSFEIKWSISSHRPHKQSNPIYTSDHFMASRKKAVRFTKSVLVQETFSQVDYDRGSDPDAICMKLTPLMAQIIKEELNAYKLHEMQVHEKIKLFLSPSFTLDALHQLQTISLLFSFPHPYSLFQTTIGFAYEYGQGGIAYDQDATPRETDKEVQGTVDVLTEYENVLKGLKQALSHFYNVEVEDISANEKRTNRKPRGSISQLLGAANPRPHQIQEQHNTINSRHYP
ncbi:hypothetical protein G6F43_003903 [Rhizopus delemar]|nr:hypothetical protein G6F43_003903 [Rhizopus delemar]